MLVIFCAIYVVVNTQLNLIFGAAKNVILTFVKIADKKIWMMTLFAMKGDIFVNFQKTEKVTIVSFVANLSNKVCGIAKQMIVNTMYARTAYQREK